MSPRRVPRVPPRPLFAIAVTLRKFLVRLWRKLAPPQIVMFESMFNGFVTFQSARTARQLGLPERAPLIPALRFRKARLQHSHKTNNWSPVSPRKTLLSGGEASRLQKQISFHQHRLFRGWVRTCQATRGMNEVRHLDPAI